MTSSIIKGTMITAASALALAAGNASAVEFVAGATSVQIYGYVIGKASYDIDEQLGDATGGSFANVNTSADRDGDGFDDDEDEITGHFDADATQSRIGFITSTDVGGSTLVTRIEGDFRDAHATSGNFRIRHAYGSWNGILGGQTWSNFNSFLGNTPTTDFNSLAGTAGRQGRVAQFRYTVGDFSVALEDPQTNVALATNVKDSLPALTAKYSTSAGAVSFAVGGLVRQIEVDNGDDSDSATGFGAFIDGNVDLGAVTLYGALNYTDGAQSYLYFSGGGPFGGFYAADAYVTRDAAGNLDSVETISGFGGSIGASFEVGNGSFNVGYGFTEVDWDDAEDDLGAAAVAAEHETNQNLFVNYLWSPVDNVTYGIEFSHWRVDEVDGADGDANRLAFITQYSF